MAKKKKPKFNPDKALLKSSVYAVKSVLNQGTKKADSAKRNTAESNASKTSLENGKKMAKIEAYAKEHGLTITQAMIHFM
nr:hypothetical protein [uncultured Pseudomonas sp.]